MSGRQKIGGALTVFGLALLLFTGAAEAAAKPYRRYYMRPNGTDWTNSGRYYTSALRTMEGIGWTVKADADSDAMIILCGAGNDSTRGAADYAAYPDPKNYSIWAGPAEAAGNVANPTARIFVVSAPWMYGNHPATDLANSVGLLGGDGFRAGATGSNARFTFRGVRFVNGLDMGDPHGATSTSRDTAWSCYISADLNFKADSCAVINSTGNLARIGMPKDAAVLNDCLISGCTFLDMSSENPDGKAALEIHGLGHCNVLGPNCAEVRPPIDSELSHRNKIQFSKLRITNNQAGGGGKAIALYNTKDFRFDYTTIEINVSGLDGYNESCASYFRDYSTNLTWNCDTVLINAPNCDRTVDGFSSSYRFMIHGSGSWGRTSEGTKIDSSYFHMGKNARIIWQDWAHRDTLTYSTFVADNWPAALFWGVYLGATVIDHCTFASNVSGSTLEGDDTRSGVIAFTSTATADADSFVFKNNIVASMKRPVTAPGAPLTADGVSGIIFNWNNWSLDEINRLWRATHNLYWVPSYHTVPHDRDLIWKNSGQAYVSSPAGDGPIVIQRNTTGSAAASQAAIPFANTSGFYVGMYVTGSTALPSRATIGAISNNVSVTVNANLGGAGIASGTTLYFNDHWFEDFFPRRDSVAFRGYPHFDNGGADTVISATAPCLLCPYQSSPAPRDSLFGARPGVFSAAIGRDQAGGTIGAVAFVGQPYARISRESWQFVCHGSVPETLTTSLTNAGNSNLVVTNLAATNGAIFTSFLDGTTIAAGASSTLRMILNCPGPFQQGERVTFNTNDTRAPLVTLNLYLNTGPTGGDKREIEP